ncbi:MAG: type II toxin-antitoxin system Phd/YefM family antitoxin [Candidatus Riflebacteria bacterium]|nr:type II toxin-antitoxin system Phd/YefM family antitoxin [Candidatus Riflebacteria bacterium]
MKAIRVKDGIVPLGEFKANAARLLKELREDNGPLVITQNGRPAAVMLAPEAYDRIQEEQAMLEAVAAGLADAEAGRVVEHDRVAEWLASWGKSHEEKAPM